MRQEFIPRKTTESSRATNRGKAITRIAARLLSAATAGTVTAADSDDQATTAGWAEVSKNEILFARRELPYYLNKTILNGDTHVTVTRFGDRPPQMNPQDTEVILGTREYRQFLDSAIDEYIEKFGVGPSTPEAQIPDGRPYTIQETQDLVEVRKSNTGELRPSSQA
jgi:hypothetical protein